MVESLRTEKPYRIGIIGDKSSLVPFWELFASLGNERVLGQLGLVALALHDKAPLDERFSAALDLPVYPGWGPMLGAHPEITMVLETTGRPELTRDLRLGLPTTISLVERAAASFFLRLLTSDQMWVACKIDLLHTQTLLKNVIDQLKEEIALTDEQGRVMDCNKAVLERLGLTKAQVTGRPLRSFFTLPETATPNGKPSSPLALALSTRQNAETTLSEVDQEGRMHYLREYAYPILDDAGEARNVLYIRRDITDRTHMEQRLQQSERLASIGEMSTYIAHEIRNPLFAISGFANQLLREATQDKEKEKLGIILAESRRLDGILKSILTFARPTESAPGLSDVNRIVRDTMDLMGMACESQNIEPILNLTTDIPLVKADPELIKQCVINLVKNSVEAMPLGGLLTVRTGLAPAHVLLEVVDTGEGIPPEVRDKVFSPFFSTKGKGSGLGLAMIKKILDDLGGSVELASIPGEGTRVTLLLPPHLAVAKAEPTG
ncbi:MAG: PAS domain-containing protein [Proteobacteria bacterium]|nr:PAS domain-containing protein [Pseudomonadota bacterium]MBU1595888.1 PAS domain-containing protein [Pseudomonadota bacterium]